MSASIIRWNALEGIELKISLKIGRLVPSTSFPFFGTPKMPLSTGVPTLEKTSWGRRNVNNPLRAQPLQMSAQPSRYPKRPRLWPAVQVEAILWTGEGLLLGHAAIHELVLPPTQKLVPELSSRQAARLEQSVPKLCMASSSLAVFRWVAQSSEGTMGHARNLRHTFSTAAGLLAALLLLLEETPAVSLPRL